MRDFDAEGYSPEDILKEFTLRHKIPRDFISLEIIEPGSKGIFGFGKKKAIVKLKFDDVEYLKRKARLYLSEILDKAGFDYSIELRKEGDNIILNILSQDSNLLIGKAATMLDALQYLVDRATKLDISDMSVLVDVDSYRQRVIEPLKEKVIKLAINVKKTGKPAKLQPMATIVRREMHIAAKSIDGVYTVSHGDGQVKSLTILAERKSGVDKKPRDKNIQNDKKGDNNRRYHKRPGKPKQKPSENE